MPESATLELLRQIKEGHAFDLEQPRYYGAPTYVAHEPGFVYTLHRRHEDQPTNLRTSASGFIYMAEHSGTHIDALSHQAWEMELFGGVSVTPDLQTPTGFTEQGIEQVDPIIRRGVLMDLPAVDNVKRLEPGAVATADDLSRATSHHDLEVREGDVALIRTGNAQAWGHPELYCDGPGIDRSAAEWLAERGVFAVGADNLALDVIGLDDADLGPLPAHTVLIVQSGIHIIENLYLEELAAEGHHEFIYLSFPLKLRGVTASPIRPLAIVIEEPHENDKS